MATDKEVREQEEALLKELEETMRTSNVVDTTESRTALLSEALDYFMVHQKHISLAEAAKRIPQKFKKSNTIVILEKLLKDFPEEETAKDAS